MNDQWENLINLVREDAALAVEHNEIEGAIRSREKQIRQLKKEIDSLEGSRKAVHYPGNIQPSMRLFQSLYSAAYEEARQQYLQEQKNKDEVGNE